MTKFQKGTTTVEFAIVGSVAMLVLLTVIEFSRVLFVVNALGEGARRGARMAIVCPINDPAIAQTSIFSRSGGSNASPVIQDLTTWISAMCGSVSRIFSISWCCQYP
jgi:Flp pilus assembly protein TadG